MFKIKFGTGKTMNASGVEERYTPATERNEGGYILTIESVPAEETIDQLNALVSESGALDTIEVSADEEPIATYSGYNVLDNLSTRLLPTGEKMATVRLGKKE